MSDWRYWITYEGIVEADEGDSEQAELAAMVDVENGKLPTIEVEEVGEDE